MNSFLNEVYDFFVKPYTFHQIVAWVIIIWFITISLFYVVERVLSPRLGKDNKFMKWWRKNIISDIDMEP